MANGELSGPRAPRLFVEDAEAVDGDRVTIRGSAVHRLTRVLRLRHNDPLEIIHEPSGRFLDTCVERVTGTTVELSVRAERPLVPEPGPRVILCPSMIRAPRFDLVMEKSTELGVHGVRPVRAVRSLAKESGRERAGRWRRIVIEAAEQCRREQAPWIDPPLELATLVAAPAVSGGLRLLSSEREGRQRVRDLLAPGATPAQVEILVGPEGGFTDEEFALATAYGWRPVTLGPRPMRAETAAVVAMAVVQEALYAAGG